MVWVQWDSDQPRAAGPCKFISAKEAIRKWPDLLIDFYEDQISFDWFVTNFLYVYPSYIHKNFYSYQQNLKKIILSFF